ncbi:MAG: hypothetical protein DRG33_06965, partial [Deltaproteobacteria bacterium]
MVSWGSGNQLAVIAGNVLTLVKDIDDPAWDTIAFRDSQGFPSTTFSMSVTGDREITLNETPPTWLYVGEEYDDTYCSIGSSTTIISDYLVTQLKPGEEGQVTIQAINYDASIYPSDSLVIIDASDDEIEQVTCIWNSPPARATYVFDLYADGQLVEENVTSPYIHYREAGTSYYRLKITDSSARVSYSQTDQGSAISAGTSLPSEIIDFAASDDKEWIIEFTFTESIGATSYVLYRDGDYFGELDTSNYPPSIKSVEGTWNFRLAAYNDYGMAPSNMDPGTAVARTGVPDKPVTFDATINDPDGVVCTWVTSPDPDGDHTYDLYRIGHSRIAEDVTSPHTYTDVACNIVDQYMVVVSDASTGQSIASNRDFGGIPCEGRPPFVTTLAVTEFSSNSFEMNWSLVTWENAVAYDLYENVGGVLGLVRADIYPGFVTDATYDCGITYFFRLHIRDKVTTKASVSNEDPGFITCRQIDPFTLFTASQNSTDHIEILYEGIINPDVVVDLYDTTNMNEPVATGISTGFLLTGAPTEPCGEGKMFRLYAYDAFGRFAWSRPDFGLKLCEGAPPPVEVFEASDNIDIYVNMTFTPVTGAETIEYDLYSYVVGGSPASSTAHETNIVSGFAHVPPGGCGSPLMYYVKSRYVTSGKMSSGTADQGASVCVPPIEVTDLEVTKNQVEQVTVTFTGAEANVQYDLYYTGTNLLAAQDLTSGDIVLLSAFITPALCGQKYPFQLDAWNTLTLQHQRSNLTVGMGLCSGEPGYDDTVDATDNLYTEIVVTFNSAVSGATSYDVYKGETRVGHDVTSPYSVSETDAGGCGVVGLYWVNALTSASPTEEVYAAMDMPGTPSNADSGVILCADAPTQPSNFTATEDEEGYIEIDFGLSTSPEGHSIQYDLYWYADPEPAQLIESDVDPLDQIVWGTCDVIYPMFVVAVATTTLEGTPSRIDNGRHPCRVDENPSYISNFM